VNTIEKVSAQFRQIETSLPVITFPFSCILELVVLDFHFSFGEINDNEFFLIKTHPFATESLFSSKPIVGIRLQYPSNHLLSRN
jgi:hypothetical protein